LSKRSNDYRAVVFDLYGTLVDYLRPEEYSRCHLDVASALGIRSEDMASVFREKIGNRWTGSFPSYEDCLAYVCKSLDKNVSPDQIAEATRVRLELVQRNLAPRNGAIETLSMLRGSGLRLGLISDCVPEVPRVWPEFVLSEFIDVAVFSPDVGVTKPDQRIYSLTCQRLGVPPEECIYVGDGGSHELTGARQAGMHPVLIRLPDNGNHVPKRPDADDWNGPVITDLGEVAHMVMGENC
jgi:putative hydrolase of the HAD superfamily